VRYTRAMASTAAIEEAFRQKERLLWSIGYRMTGVAADADEIVQEAFARALEQPRSLEGEDLERWLVRVATNLGLDRLRRRRRRAYAGSWLPSPIEAEESAAPAEHGAERRYELADTVSYAWLLALETLGPKARAVLVLADVLDYGAADVARILDLTEGNVRVLHHRARRALEHVGSGPAISAATRERQQEALAKFVACMVQQDAAGMEALLAADVRSITDAAGRYTALREPLDGRARVARFHLETGRRRAPISTIEIRSVNGAPALVIATRPLRAQMAPRLVLRVEVASDGLIREIQTVLAPDKLTAVRFPDAPPASSADPGDDDAGESTFETAPEV
jgi:RNA polymerase sigma factor (sigma-70 family)